MIHWIRSGSNKEGKGVKPFEILVKIIECGYLIPSFARRGSIYDKTSRPTIRGPYPAVCFTAQSLDNFILSCHTLPSHYKPYGIALYKRALYLYGGRPVIYESEEILGQLIRPGEPRCEEGKEIFKGGLPIDYQYLWVRYEPIPNADGYVVDWTHEREWRCRARDYHDIELGLIPKEGVPLLLPSVYDHQKGKLIHYLPKILVQTVEEKNTLGELIKTYSPQWAEKCGNKYLQAYFSALSTRVKIIALNSLPSDTDSSKLEWIISNHASNN